VHQASELWFKVILHEIDALVGALERRETMFAVLAVRRLNALVRIVSAHLSALDTLPPQRFAQFRGYLGTSSGSQSVQFRAIEAASGLREPGYLRALEAHGRCRSPSAPRSRVRRSRRCSRRTSPTPGVTLESLYTGPAPTPLFSWRRGCWSTSSSSRSGGSCTCSSWSASSARSPAARAARSARATCRAPWSSASSRTSGPCARSFTAPRPGPLPRP
jgi:hypothetical protein